MIIVTGFLPGNPTSFGEQGEHLGRRFRPALNYGVLARNSGLSRIDVMGLV
jgi:hypothetical protein